MLEKIGKYSGNFFEDLVASKPVADAVRGGKASYLKNIEGKTAGYASKLDDFLGSTSASQNQLLASSGLHGAALGAAIGGGGSLFTDAGFWESAMMGGLTGGLGSAGMQRYRMTKVDSLNARNSRLQSAIDKIPTYNSWGKTNRKGKRVLNRSGKRRINEFFSELQSNNSKLNSATNVSYRTAGTLGGLGSLSYATLDANKY